jgi:hypothetical protein
MSMGDLGNEGLVIALEWHRLGRSVSHPVSPFEVAVTNEARASITELRTSSSLILDSEGDQTG